MSVANPSELFDFWKELRSEETIHPKDQEFFDSAREHGLITSHRPPGPWDGPLRTAKVVICYANPRYDPEDEHRQALIRSQLTGCEDLPNCWDQWYLPRIGGISSSRSMDELRKVVSIFNVCPYSSKEMNDREVRLTAGLPSCWAAQKHLREVLMPRALEGEIFLVVARKHQLWGVVEGRERDTCRLIRNRGGYFEDTCIKIREWLSKD